MQTISKSPELNSSTDEVSELQSIAEAVSNGLGEVKDIYLGEPEKGSVILLDEYHHSVNAQVEIAHMLMRLRNDFGVKTIGLEGAFPDINYKPYFLSNFTEIERLNLAGRLLAEGEISNVEFMILAFDDVVVEGIDSEKEYSIHWDDSLTMDVLSKMVLKVWNAYDKKQKELQDKAEQSNENSVKTNSNNLTDRGIEEAIKSDETLYHLWKGTLSDVGGSSKYKNKHEAIFMEGEKRGIKVIQDHWDSLKNREPFLEAVDIRSDIMVKNIAKICKRTPEIPIPSIIGAGHTERMVEAFKDIGLSYALITHASVNIKFTEHMLLLDFQQQAKYGKRPLTGGFLGTLLRNLMRAKRLKKYPPVIAENWLAIKGNIYNIVYRVAKGVLVDKTSVADLELNLPSDYRVDKASITEDGKEVIFPIEISIGDKTETLWVKATYSSNVKHQYPENERVEEAVRHLLTEAGGEVKGMELSTDKLQTFGDGPVQVSEGVFAIFAAKKENL